MRWYNLPGFAQVPMLLNPAAPAYLQAMLAQQAGLAVRQAGLSKTQQHGYRNAALAKTASFAGK
ncbi:MAG: hypothetical protein H6559_32630 [Lewinellaceae bacterium]|nr:hypothetical protein [Lewinellaceae bacterium]